MRTRRAPALVALAATLAMAVAVSSASANRLSISNPKFRITWTTLEFIIGTGATFVRCGVTLEGSFHSATIRKIIGALLGNVTRAVVRSEACTGGRARFLPESLPWHVAYNGFTGMLPNITSFTTAFKGVRFELFALGISCLYADNGTLSISGSFLPEASRIPEFIFEPEAQIPRFSGNRELCGPTAGLQEDGQVFLLGNTSRISLTLI
jgi:hypothetical protein